MRIMLVIYGKLEQTIKSLLFACSRLFGKPDNEFWGGIKRTFGIDPRHIHRLEEVKNTLSQHSSIPVHRVLKKADSVKEYIVVEKLKDQMVTTYSGYPASMLESLGEGLSRIHQIKRIT
jgi:hypothetical protein